MSVARRLYGLRKNGSESDRTSVNDKLHSSLFNDSPKDYVISSSPKIFSAIHPDDITDNFYISDKELEAYAQGFLDVATQENIQELLLDKEVEDEGLSNVALDDTDVKLSLYRSFKSLYDKWISNSGDSPNSKRGYFFNNYGERDDRTLFDHFRFVDRAGRNIGGEAAIDTAILTELTSSSGGKGPTKSLYRTLTDILGKNNFDFWPIPADIPLTTANLSNDKLAEMFKPLDFIDEIKAGPIFNCVFIGGNSRTLKDLDSKSSNCNLQNNDYVDDSFDLTDKTDWPEDFNYNSDDKGLAIFKVRYGQEAQNHFQTLALDQTEFKETQESLKIIDALASPKKGNSPSQAGKGNNIYDLYLTRSYNCTVTGLGNMSIQPLMYFKLENVPMFRGTYLINEVKHKITPQKVETEFKGLRQPRVTVPIVTDPISLLDLALSDVSVDGERGSLGGVGGTSVGPAASTFTNGYDASTGTYNLNFDNKEYPVVPGGKCPGVTGKKGCKDCLGEEFTFVNGFDTPITFSGQEIKPFKKGSKVSFNSHIRDRILPIINSQDYKDRFTKGHRMFAIVWAIKEGYKPGSRSYRSNNPGNIGNTDSGANKNIATLEDGMELLMDFINQASVGNTKYGKGWAFGEKDISPNFSREIANNPQNYKRVNGCLPGYKGNYQGQLGYFTKKYATFSRVSNGSLGRLLTIFELNGKTGVNGNTTIAELLAFNDTTEIRFK